MNTKNNLRYRENEERIISAVLDLMSESDVRHITVSGICEKAGVNRTTFYAHFDSVYSVMDRIENKISEEMFSAYTVKNANLDSTFSYDSFVIFLEHVRKHQHFYRTFFNFRKEFTLSFDSMQFWEVAIKPYYKKAGIVSEREINYYYSFFYSGFVTVVKDWVNNDCRESETDIARIIKNCVPQIN